MTCSFRGTRTWCDETVIVSRHFLWRELRAKCPRVIVTFYGAIAPKCIAGICARAS